jgi:uncharacterized membrane protein
MNEALSLGKTRIEALSDGIFAFAMTLLIVDLKPPDACTRSAQGHHREF